MLKAIDIAWTAGFLEGEGSFTCRGKAVIVTASQVQPEPILRLQHFWYARKRLRVVGAET